MIRISTVLICILNCACANNPDPRDIAWQQYVAEHEWRSTSPHWWKCELPTPEIWVEQTRIETTTGAEFCSSEFGLCE